MTASRAYNPGVLPSGRRLALALTADGEVDLVRCLVETLGGVVDRVVVVEGRTTFHGDRRDVLGGQWARLLGVPESLFRSIVIELPPRGATGVGLRRRELIQRSAIALGVRDLAADDLVLAVDSDEFVDPDWLVAHEADIHNPTRLLLIPMFGGLDRRAADWHCCRDHLTLTPGVWPTPDNGFLFPGGVIGPVGDLAGRGTHDWRGHPVRSLGPAGWHLLHVLPADDDPARKHARQAHDWDERADTSHMRRALRLGVHPYGWWSAFEMEVPARLRFVADRHPQAVLGPLPRAADREATLRGWWAAFADDVG